MRVFLIVTLFVLVSCGGGSSHFRGVQAQEVTVGGTVFAVRAKGTLAEAVRLTPQYAPRLSGIAPLAERAISIATGCRVLTIRGDAAQILAELDCTQPARYVGDN